MGDATSSTSTAEPAEPRDDVLKILSSRTNRAILSLLAVEPTYPRKIGNLLSLSEAEAARRLKHMEGLGLVTSAWNYVGKNIKVYKLAVDGVLVRFSSDGLRLELQKGSGAVQRSFTLVPFQMNVPKPDGFHGRGPELALLAGPDRVIVIEGMPGIGKTSLVAKHVSTDAPGKALFWHTFRGLESLHWLLNRFGVFLAQHGDSALLQSIEQNSDINDRRELLLRSLDNERFVVVFDDVHRIEDAAVREFLTDAINRIQHAKLIVTGREAPRYNVAAPNRRVIHLDGLGDKEVAEFFAHRNIKIDPILLPKVRDEVGGHPLALNLLLEAAQELKVPVPQLLDRIPERNIEDYLLQEVYGTLSDDEKATLSLASLFRAGFNADDLNVLAKRNYEHLLLKLRRKLLVQSRGNDYALPEVIHNFFYKLLKDREALHAKAAQHYLARNNIEGRLEAMHHYLQANKKDQVLALLEENVDLQDFDYIDAGYQNLYYDILNLFKRSEVTDPRRWALILDEKGDILYTRGDASAALANYDDSVAHFSKTKDTERILDLTWKRGLALEKLGRAQDALPACQAALEKPSPDGQARRRLQEFVARIAEQAPLPKPKKKPRAVA